MQGIKASHLLSRFSGLKRVPGLLVLLSALAAIPVLGQVSVITLAMASYDPLPAKTISAAHDDSAANPLAYATVPHLQYQITGLKLDHQNPAVFTSDFQLKEHNGTNLSNLSDLTQFVCRKSNAFGQMVGWMHVEAGYGQFCQYGSCFGSNAVELELQQPKCAFLRASFSF
jgi:hypothetical protein